MLAIITSAFTYLATLLGGILATTAIPRWLTSLLSVLTAVLKTRVPMPA